MRKKGTEVENVVTEAKVNIIGMEKVVTRKKENGTKGEKELSEEKKMEKSCSRKESK